ncbi:MAG: isoprenylcysteine carboxylmethyltransferase family protein [Candidatus Thorarchaeota archaeon]|nr:isoprenylcysteine carboxylmethyltransferase family protein [Candidatus Thorarchaeota archaeon]
MVDYEEMKKKYPRGMILFQGFVMVVVSTVMSLLLISPLYIFDIDGQLLVDIFTFPIDFIPLPINLIGIPLIPIGLLLTVWANYTLLHIGKIGLRAREPMQTPSTLVVSGPYRYSRNPLYLGALIALFGLVIVWSSLVVFLGSVAVFVIFRYKFIKREEIILEEEFGDEYRDFKKHVRRWL